MNATRLLCMIAAAALCAAMPTISHAQARETRSAAAPTARAPVAVAPDYLIGADDVLSIVFWKDKEMSAEVTVRPDGKISLPLLNDITAAGLTPDQLREGVLAAAAQFIEQPQATVIVKEIKSRQVFITGQVEKPGSYSLTTQMTVLQLIASAGGLREFANRGDIVVIRTESGRQVHHKFDYDDVVRGKNPQQNLEMKPGDTVVVP